MKPKPLTAEQLERRRTRNRNHNRKKYAALKLLGLAYTDKHRTREKARWQKTKANPVLREQNRLAAKAYYAKKIQEPAFKEKRKEASKRSYHAHKQYYAAYYKEYCRQNPEAARAWRRKAYQRRHGPCHSQRRDIHWLNSELRNSRISLIEYLGRIEQLTLRLNEESVGQKRCSFRNIDPK